MAELQTWYRAFRKQGNKPPDAIWSARCHAEAEAKANATLAALVAGKPGPGEGFRP